MRTSVIYNHKGGVAKTVTTVNLAYNLAEDGYRVLVVDMDPQGNASSFFHKYDINRASVKDLLVGKYHSDRCCFRTSYKRVDILPANVCLREVTPNMLIKGRETLRSGLERISDTYDYCIIDCPPSVDFLTEVIMAAAGDVIIPLKPDRFSADGVGTVLEVVKSFGCEHVVVKGLFTQYYRHKDALKSINSIMTTSEVAVYENVIRRCSAVDHSILVRRPLAKCASRSIAAADYKDFAAEYLKDWQEVGKDGITS